MSPPLSLLCRVINDKKTPLNLIPSQWDLLVRQARSANVLASLGHRLDTDIGLENIPDQPRVHIESAMKIAERLHQAVGWEAQCIFKALQPLGVEIVFLKGAAYVLRELPCMKGRIFNDVDILVPKVDLAKVEQALIDHGWAFDKLDAYDQKYYRTWMHELPPMSHQRRHTSLDVHHTILPETARLKPDPLKLLNAAQPLPRHVTGKTWAPVDMVLHSATHLFHDGELEQGFRDLLDLDGLLREYQSQQFWQALVQRADEMQLSRPLYYALIQAAEQFKTPIPKAVMKEVSKQGKPPVILSMIMRFLLVRALRPDHKSCADRFTAMARWFLYLRSHYLRMPLWLLMPHLIRKIFKNGQQSEHQANL